MKNFAIVCAVVLAAVAILYFAGNVANEISAMKYDIRMPDGAVLRDADHVEFYPHRIEFVHEGRRHRAYGASASRVIE